MINQSEQLIAREVARRELGPLVTTADPRRRMISVLRSDHKVDRYVLHRYPGGDVAWRGDTFTAPADPTQQERWIAYHGELTVAEVIVRVPDQARTLRDWTRDEIQRGVFVEGADDLPSQARRERALERLRHELADASPARPAASQG